MVALQPALLACPTATLHDRAQQLAAGLSSGPAVPTKAARRRGATLPQPGAPATPAAGTRRRAEAANPAAPARPPPATTPAPTPAPTPAAASASETAARVPLRPGPRRATAAARDECKSNLPTTVANDKAEGGSGGAHAARVAPAAVPAAAAIALIARQPVLLEVPLERLCRRSHELAELLGASPHDACLSFTRLRPGELDQVLQAPLPAVRAAWLRFAAAMASLEQSGQLGPASPASLGRRMVSAEAQGEGGDEGAEDAGSTVAIEASGGVDSASQQRQGNHNPRQQQQQLPGQVQLPLLRSPMRRPAAPSPDRLTQRMVLLCPQLLMLPAATARASALHLRALLGLTTAALRRLLARSPRLLLLSPRHRMETLRALVHGLGLRHPRDASRLIAQQPNLLKWTPEALQAKLADIAAALGLPAAGVTRLCRNQPALLAMSGESLAAKLLRLQAALDLPDADSARRVALQQPGVLSMGSEAVERKVPLLARALDLGADGAGRGRARWAGAGLEEARRLAAAEPTLLTMNVALLPRRVAVLADVLGAATLHEARAAALSCPRLLVLQRGALQQRLREVAWGLEAPVGAVKALTLARPSALFASLEALRAAVRGAEAAGAGKGLRGRRRVAAALEYLAREREVLLGAEVQSDVRGVPPLL